MKYEEVFVIDGERMVLCISRNSDQDILSGFGTHWASIHRILPNGDWDISESYDGPWSSCVRWLGRSLDKTQRQLLYQGTGMRAQNLRQSEDSTRKGAATEQYVASYLAIHYGLTVHVSKPGTPSKDLIAFKDGCERGCAIQVKYRESARTIKINSNTPFDFLVCVTSGSLVPIKSPHSPERYRHQLASFIAPASDVVPGMSFGYYYSNYAENWEAILNFFQVKAASYD